MHFKVFGNYPDIDLLRTNKIEFVDYYFLLQVFMCGKNLTHSTFNLSVFYYSWSTKKHGEVEINLW